MNRFITESEVEEAKKKRAEEWEAAREAGRELRKYISLFVTYLTFFFFNLYTYKFYLLYLELWGTAF